jgi:hypothetical protein
VELLGEAGDGQGGHVPGVGIDEGHVVAGVGQVTLGGEGQPAVGAALGQQCGGEGGLR